jgi:PAS domain S-box-containing protein
MEFQYNIFSITLLASGISTALMSLFIFRQLKGSSNGFVWIMVSITFWTLFYGLELASTSLTDMLFWINFEYLGIALLPACWIMFVIRFTGREKWLTPTIVSLILLVPLVTLLLVWTNKWHHLHYAQVSVDTGSNFPLLVIVPGMAYWVLTVYFYAMLAWGSILMLLTFRKANPLYKKQNSIILIGAFIPWITNLLYMLQIRPFKHLDLTPYGLIITAFVISYGLLKFKLLDLVPVAREKVIEAMREGVLVLDAENRVIDFNVQLGKLLRQETGLMVGNNIFSLLPETAKLHQLVKEQTNTTIEIELSTESDQRSQVTYLEVDYTAFVKQRSVYNGALLLFRDITARKEAENRATAAYQLLSGVLDSSLSGVMAFRSVRDGQQKITDFTCIACNRRATNIFAPDTHDLVGTRLLELVPFIRDNGFFEAYVQVVETRKPLEREIHFLFQEKKIWLQIAAVKLEDGFTITFSNISERKKAEQLLQRNEANLSALIENTSDLIWSIDRNYQFMTINSAFKKLYSPDGERTPQIGEVLDLQKLHSQQAALWKYFYDRAWHGNAFTVETLMKVNDTLQTYECSLNPIRNLKGEVEGITVFSRNITQRKEAENEIQLARKAAENANQFKTRFLANITHEIRTPINAILGFSEILKKQTLSSDQHEYLDYILNAGDILLKLIGGVLDLTKIEQGKMVLEQENFHVQEVLSTAIDPYKFRAQENGLQFQIDFDPTLPLCLQGDSGKICQVVINLIGNALKFTNNGGIRIEFTQAGEKSAIQQEIMLKVMVSDTGIGIAKEKQELIFQSFTQADASINRKYGGSGLGLSIIKEMVQLMGGDLGVISPAIHTHTLGGPGSTFWFTLPLKKVPLQAVPQTETTRGNKKIHFGGRVKVLMAEDNTVNQRLARLIMQDAGCVVTIAENGQDAFAAVQQQAFDVVFMDLQMPVMDGYTATRQIRTVNQDIPIIGLSANVYKEDIEQCFQAGMNDYLSKPYSAEKLLQKLQRWIDNLVLPEELPAAKASSLIDNGRHSHIDLKQMEELTGGMVDEMKEMLQAVIAVEKEFMAALNEWFLNQNHLKLATTAHKLKPCLYLIGLDNYRETLEKLEQQTKTAVNTDELSQLCIELRAIFSEAEVQLEKYLMQYS